LRISLDTKTRYFEVTVWPHVRSAYNFARWLVRNNHDAEDVVQEAFLKAFKSIESFRGGDARAWVLSIVRNTALNFLARRKPDERGEWTAEDNEPADRLPNPEREILQHARREEVRRALARLEPEFRDVIVLREIEDLSYKEIAAVLDIPIGTVMSRLSRARQRLLMELKPIHEVRYDLP